MQSDCNALGPGRVGDTRSGGWHLLVVVNSFNNLASHPVGWCVTRPGGLSDIF